MAVDDARLVGRAALGDEAAYEELLARHRPALVRACVDVLRDAGAAADVAQEAALVAWLQLDRLREAPRFGAWLVGIGRNLALRAARERWRRERWLSEDARRPDEPETPEQRVLARERASE